MPRQHQPDRHRVPLRQPQSFRVFIHDEGVAVAVATTEQANGVMSEPVVERGEPFHRPRVVEVLDNVNIPPERREELAGGNRPAR